ncbi:MAG: hypothetical protein R6X25_16320 [Candidatus Krumholzibacteriia bacterium]
MRLHVPRLLAPVSRRLSALAALLLLVSSVAASTPAAGADTPRDSRHPRATVLVSRADADTVILDLGEIDRAVENAMAEARAALAELDDLQLHVSVGRDNRLRVETGDDLVEVDLDALWVHVRDGLSEAMAELDRELSREWCTRAADRAGASSLEADEDLRAELRQLKRELRQLRRDLRESRRDR